MRIPSEIAFVAIGAAFGGVLRWTLNKLLGGYVQTFPWATLTANVITSFFVGLVYAYLGSRSPENTILKPLLITGLCGGLSTFSAFSYENVSMLSEGKPMLALINIGLNLCLCLLATWLGIVSWK